MERADSLNATMGNEDATLPWTVRNHLPLLLLLLLLLLLFLAGRRQGSAKQALFHHSVRLAVCQYASCLSATTHRRPIARTAVCRATRNFSRRPGYTGEMMFSATVTFHSTICNYAAPRHDGRRRGRQIGASTVESSNRPLFPSTPQRARKTSEGDEQYVKRAWRHNAERRKDQCMHPVSVSSTRIAARHGSSAPTKQTRALNLPGMVFGFGLEDKRLCCFVDRVLHAMLRCHVARCYATFLDMTWHDVGAASPCVVSCRGIRSWSALLRPGLGI
ncbi:hypothetical protein IWZ03DRAFT_47166 [Phyllosticta citriasiana]|uniref:Uncharacterized protein n=1 Tax=Phyllosticta citriasiana TaxID=595635 RepID=A0ABR1KI04_9PEZI